MTVVYYYTKSQKEVKFALVRENISLRSHKVACSPSFLTDIGDFPMCIPNTCGRIVTDKLIDTKESTILLNLAKRTIDLAGGSSGGASILDVHSGALSKGEQFVNIYKLQEAKTLFKKEDLVAYKVRFSFSQYT